MPHKLLLADDSVTIQRVIELTFADEDVHVLAVGDGKKAIASIQADRPDIVLADVGMPERDGYEVAAFVKGNPQYANIPVLLLTGAFEPIDETRARAVGCDGVLVKPFEPQMVINRVKDLLAGRRPAGLWSGNQSAQKPLKEAPRAPAAAEPSAPAVTPAASSATSASLEDYFDRLDAAFASVEAATELHPSHASGPTAGANAFRTPTEPAAQSAPAAGSGLTMDDLAGWDPDLIGDPQKPAALAAAPAVSSPPLSPAPMPPIVAPPVPAEERRASWPEPPAAAPARAPIAFKPVAVPAPVEPPVSVAPVAPVLEPAPQSVAARVTIPASSSPPETPAAPPVSSAPVAPYRIPETPAASAPEPLAQTPAGAPGPSAAASIGVPMPSLAEAFATLLAAEQGRVIAPSAAGQDPATVSDGTVDEIVQRVIARLSDQTVRQTVLDVAERLVREEIDRIKGRST